MDRVWYHPLSLIRNIFFVGSLNVLCLIIAASNSIALRNTLSLARSLSSPLQAMSDILGGVAAVSIFAIVFDLIFLGMNYIKYAQGAATLILFNHEVDMNRLQLFKDAIMGFFVGLVAVLTAQRNQCALINGDTGFCPNYGAAAAFSFFSLILYVWSLTATALSKWQTLKNDNFSMESMKQGPTGDIESNPAPQWPPQDE